MENNENDFKRGKIPADKKQVAKYAEICRKQFLTVKHKTRLKLLIGSAGVTNYFNHLHTTEKHEHIINEYFKDYLK